MNAGNAGSFQRNMPINKGNVNISWKPWGRCGYGMFRSDFYFYKHITPELTQLPKIGMEIFLGDKNTGMIETTSANQLSFGQEKHGPGQYPHCDGTIS